MIHYESMSDKRRIPHGMIGEVLEFLVHGDHTGSLVALEKGADFPFEIKRVYYIWGTARDVVRGHHAHKGGASA